VVLGAAVRGRILVNLATPEVFGSRDDRWSVEVRKCIADAANGAAMKVCAGALPPSQRAALPEKVRP